MHCLSHTHKGAHEVRGSARARRCFTRDLGNAPRGPDYLARGCSGRKLLLVDSTWLFLRVDLDRRNGAFSWPHPQGNTWSSWAMFYTWPCCMLVLCRLYTTPLHVPLRVHRCNHRQYSTLYGAITGEVCTSVLFHCVGSQTELAIQTDGKAAAK